MVIVMVIEKILTFAKKIEPMLKPSLFIQNRDMFIADMPDNSIAVFAANSPMPRNGDQFYPYRQQSDFFYLTGIDVENAYLIISKNNTADVKLYIEPYDEHKAIWMGEMLDDNGARATSGILEVRPSTQFWSDMAIEAAKCDTIMLNRYEYPGYECAITTPQEMFINEVKSRFPLHQYQRIAPILNRLRMIKKDEEIEVTRHACNITAEAFRRCLKTVEPDRYEYQIQAEIEYVFKTNNATGHAYAPIVAGGKNACCLHYSKNQSKLNDGDLLLFDIGCEYENYSSDLSRTIPVNGRFTPRQKDCYEAVLRVMKEITKLYRPGGTIQEVNDTTYRLMEEEMIKLGLFTAADVKCQDPQKPLYRRYLMHGMSHHIGLDVHDSVDKFVPFKPGMILTCEPGLYIREEGIGIRIENDLLITENEPINLFEGLPIEVGEIEAEMRK